MPESEAWSAGRRVPESEAWSAGRRVPESEAWSAGRKVPESEAWSAGGRVPESETWSAGGRVPESETWSEARAGCLCVGVRAARVQQLDEKPIDFPRVTQAMQSACKHWRCSVSVQTPPAAQVSQWR